MYVLNNNLDETIEISLDLPQSEEKWVLVPNQSIGFGQQLVEKLFASGQQRGVKHGIMEDLHPSTAIIIKVDGYHKSVGILIERIGTRGFVLKGDDRDLNCIVEIKAIENEKHVKIQSGTLCVNNTDETINLEFMGEVVNVSPQSSFALPLRWIRNPNIYPSVLGINEAILLNKEGCIQVNDNSWVIIEIDQYQTDTDINQTLIQFKAPFVFTNLLPCPVSIFTNLNEIPVTTINPGNYFTTLSLDPSLEDNTLRFFLNVDNQYSLETDWINAKNPGLINIELQGPYSGNFIVLETSHNFENNPAVYDLKYKAVQNSEESSRKIESKMIEIFSKFCVVNKTNYSLDCGSEKMKIHRHSFGFCNNNGKLKVRVSDIPTAWSAEFNTEAVGISGLISLDNSQAKQYDPQAPDIILLGVNVIDAPPPLIKTKIVYITPRFMVNNQLGYTVYIRQARHADEYGKLISEINAGKSFQYQPENANLSKLIQISRNSIHWSSPFSTDRKSVV